MNAEPKIEFYIALNVMELSPRDMSYWQGCARSICADLANRHALHVCAYVGAYVQNPKIGNRPFYLFSQLLDLDKQENLEKYHEVESKVEEAIKSYIKP